MKKYKNSIKLFKICLFLLGIGIIFSFGIDTTAAASTATATATATSTSAVSTPNIYVNGSSGNDNWDPILI